MGKNAEALQLRRSCWGDWARLTLRAQGHELKFRLVAYTDLIVD